MRSTSPDSTSTFHSTRKNDTISLKDRLSGFGTTSKYTAQNNYNTNFYGREKKFVQDNHIERHRHFERERNLYERSRNYESNYKSISSKSKTIKDSKFEREEKRLSDDSDSSSDSSDGRDEHKKRLNSFVSTSTIAKKRLSKI